MNNKEKTVDISRLIPFHYNPTRVNPEAIAAKEKDMFIVESILTHKRINNQYSFQVKWEGYDDPEDLTWEPIANLRNNSVFHTYCRMNNLNLIPKEYRN